LVKEIEGEKSQEENKDEEDMFFFHSFTLTLGSARGTNFK
jgi:hypothetical protein